MVLGGSAKRKAILEYVSVASKDNDDFSEQLLQTDDDMLNESDIAIKQGSHKKSVPQFCATRYLLLVVRQHLIGSQVLTRCPPLFVVHGIQAVVESRSSREIDNIPQI